ncbi:MAG: PaaI family thioesterase [Bacillales bacterium]|jgi:acyl-coenzyme A thioesterase PaaI-like protein|nr:PaaI family thioesterase [Bacillales bacterium]
MRIKNKQHNSSSCFVCGLKNKKGLHTRFFELENGLVFATINLANDYNSYQGRTHGGIISALLDETIGRAISIIEPNTFGVTTTLIVKYKAPTPLKETLICLGKIISNNRFVFEGIGKIIKLDGTVVASAVAKYFKMDVEKINNGPLPHQEWFIEEGELPNINGLEHLLVLEDV